MRVQTRAYLNTLSTMAVLAVVEIIFFQVVDNLGFSWAFFVIAPLAFLAAVIFWLHKVTGIRCNSCNNLYGISIGLDGWPSIPNKCVNCGADDNAL